MYHDYVELYVNDILQVERKTLKNQVIYTAYEFIFFGINIFESMI